MMVLVLLILIMGFVVSNPLPDTLDNRLLSQIEKELLLSAKNRLDIIDESSNKMNGMIKNVNKTLSIPKYIQERFNKAIDFKIRDKESHEKETIGRRHKAVFVDYPLISHIAYYSKLPIYQIDYNANSDITTKDITTKDKPSGESERYQESDIFYIRLPPTPYVFVPSLGYISQSSMYSSAALKTAQIPVVPQLLQMPHTKLGQPQPISQQTINPLIKLPTDFVSNGKPFSVYQWQKKPSKKPANNSITNNLSVNFVSNGKPISIYQWQTNFKPAKKPDSSFNSLDMTPYIFNGKLTSMYLLGLNGSTSMQQSIQYPDYQDNYQKMYY